ncbi:hypothetical protein POJ06DRAFT_242448 [Lipomyces tetrasporus]|uniref:Zn(2)-C6 fungal-type domain-containing protein n=1 Tax=Lipomyces tetrasporus TaxID=54092 RepID=A0AAD7VW41_9ASCO|nr:uncharacterized protein POJ06DRAFT_242448 [Lipomyces tetrasporus]KAJ8103614.1 hypothetical protein POJ06DRAFT_242448 [Lipomyces tetrasporus]
MPSRRSHSKSRLGCFQCKKRRVKCDEKVPCCGNCAKQKITCNYAGASASHLLLCRSTYTNDQNSLDADGWSSSDSIGSSVSSPFFFSITASTKGDPLSTTSPSSLNPLHISSNLIARNCQFTSDLYMHDLELMHHYSTQTYRTLSDARELQEIWQTIVPKVALNHRFLMHGLLALSAFHLVRLNSADNVRIVYMEIARRHQVLSLCSFRPETDNITTLNCDAVFAFSGILSVIAFASSQCTEIEQGMTPVEEVLQAFGLIRGVSEILRTSWDWIGKGQLAPLVQNMGTRIADSVPPDVRAALDHLDEINNDNLDSEAKSVYYSAIHELRVSFEKLCSKCEQVRTALAWSSAVSPAFIALLKSRQPIALVILAHYCVILRRLDGCWWLTGWSARLVEEIYRSLDASWQPSIRWPVKVIGLAG